NVAKHLHAGHIRSTIIGHALHYLYEATGHTAFGMNFINDWGGFGYLMEAYRRWGDEEKNYQNKNDFLYALYLRFRTMEKEAENQDGAPFVEFKEKADALFRDLEAGKSEVVELWEKMVGWSLQDFNRFYDLINIHLDVVDGEAFYARRGNALVEEALAAHRATIENEAAVVHVGSDVDFVIRRSDESTIYATRDLAALEFRSQEVGAERIVYVVGQEQTDYFARLFKATDILKIAKPGTVLQHVPFGFYVSASTKKKLSSREGAQNVISLIESAIDYFAKKYPDLAEADIKKIAVGSITFNDIKKSRMMPVELDTGNIQKMIQGFEESGAAYVMYAVARARSIVRKHAGGVPTMAELSEKGTVAELAPVETVLLKRIASLADTIVRAAETNEPSVLAEYLVRLAQDYNSYYESFPV
ncbi:MAG TPA: arginine--tRNA ligase, partial [Nitrososphaera sp.]|nr:arginine--tRNA ligase [Nitrososphaera sp.]